MVGRLAIDCCFFFSLCQNYIRRQESSKNSYNLVHESLQFLDCICGSTSGGLGLLGLYINEHNVGLINQCLESLTEYCQGPCHENQVRRQLLLTPTAGLLAVTIHLKPTHNPGPQPKPQTQPKSNPNPNPDLQREPFPQPQAISFGIKG